MTISTTRLDPGPTTVALDLLHRLQTAWNAGDGAGFGRAYAADASFVTIRGEHIVGSTAIGAGHQGIFGSIYAGSVNDMALVRAEEVAPGVVLALSLNTLDVPAGPLAGRHRAMSTSVVVRQADGGWLATVTHNTLVAA
jgi:uncharacterized protein (TIGR02246 family)